MPCPGCVPQRSIFGPFRGPLAPTLAYLPHEDHDFYASVPLDKCKREIRILRLLPGEYEHVLKGQLLKVEVEGDNLDFEALSYTWDTFANRKSIILDGSDGFHVTDNLEAALRRMRSSFAARDLWIDAICIDQNNLTERSSQVLLMRQIYRNAKRILVWIGDQSRDTEGFDPMKAFPTVMKSATRKWWDRVWVVQEFALARQVTILFGQHEVAWEPFFAMAGARDNITLFSRRDIEQLALLENARARVQRKEYLTMLQMLRLTSYAQATDPRDKIYALLGLAQDEAARTILPTYDLPTDEVFADLAIRLEHQIQVQSGEESRLDLFAVPSEISFLKTDYIRSWHLLSPLKDPFKVSILQDEIFLRPLVGFNKVSRLPTSGGCALDVLFSCDIGLLPDSLLAFANADQAEIRVIGEKIIVEQSMYFAPDPYQSLQLHFRSPGARIVKPRFSKAVSLSKKYFEGSYNEIEDILCQIFYDWSACTNSPSVPTRVDALVDLLRRWLSKLRRSLGLYGFFMTERGFLGLGPSSMQKGDVVAVLCGSNVPFLLRRQGDEYARIGLCYVHGIMNGELKKECPGMMLDVQDFVIR